MGGGVPKGTVSFRIRGAPHPRVHRYLRIRKYPDRPVWMSRGGWVISTTCDGRNSKGSLAAWLECLVGMLIDGILYIITGEIETRGAYKLDCRTSVLGAKYGWSPLCFPNRSTLHFFTCAGRPTYTFTCIWPRIYTVSRTEYIEVGKQTVAVF